MPSRKIEKIDLSLMLEYATTLPASPRVFARLSQLVQNEDSSLDYISTLIKMDPGLAAQILRVTNSAYYGASFKINEIETAISRIGFIEIQKILSMIVTHDCFYQALPAYGQTATEYADECIAVAVTSETLAKRVGFDPNAPYISGLLHGIGKLAINLYLEKMGQKIDLTAIAPDQPLIAVEQEVIGFNHFRAGFELLSHWQFEAKIWNPIKNQSFLLNSPSFLKESALLHLAIWVSQQIKGFDPDGTLPDTIRWCLHLLGIDALDIARLIDEARFEIIDRQNMLSLLL